MNDWAAYLKWRERFAEAMDPRFYTLEWLDRQVYNNLFRFWSNDNAAIVAQIETYPTGAKEVHGTIAAGDLSEIVKLIPEAEKWGRSLGCIVGAVNSHPAWEKLLKKDGYEPSQLMLRKEL